MNELNEWARKVLEKAKKNELEATQALERKKKEEEANYIMRKDLVLRAVMQVERIAEHLVQILDGDLGKNSPAHGDSFNLEIRLGYGTVHINRPSDIYRPSYIYKPLDAPDYIHRLGCSCFEISTSDISGSFRRKLKTESDDSRIDCEKYYVGWSLTRQYAFCLFAPINFKQKKFEKALKDFCESALGV